MSGIETSMDWPAIIIGLLGGLALFLYGMVVMTDSLKAAAGNKLKSFLAGMTSNRWKAMLAGTGITAIIQSSSVTTVLAVGFVSAGLMSFQQTLGLILGANIGTTITAQIIALKVTDYALVIVLVGYLLTLISKRKKYRNYGLILLGLGLVFLGMNIMSAAAKPLRSYEPFIHLMQNLGNPLTGILIGAVFTALVQSSSATTGIVIVLASQNLISTEAGIVLVLGANIGTCVTAMLAAIGKPRTAIQVAMAHVLFKVVGVLLWVGLIPFLESIVASISPNDLPRQIANAHTIFNVTNSFLFIGTTVYVARLIERIFPAQIGEDDAPDLDPYYLDEPGTALDMAHQALKKQAELTLSLANNAFDVSVGGDENALTNLRRKDQSVDKIHTMILGFLGRLQLKSLNEKQAKALSKYVELSNLIETVADLFTTHMVEAADHRIEMEFKVSEKTKEQLADLYHLAIQALTNSINANINSDAVLQQAVLDSKDPFKKRCKEVQSVLLGRLSDSAENHIPLIRFETELIEIARRLHVLARRIARN